MPSAVEALSLNHWITREGPKCQIIKSCYETLEIKTRQTVLSIMIYIKHTNNLLRKSVIKLKFSFIF